MPDNIKCVDRDSLLGLILEKRGSVLRRVLLDADLTRLVSDLLGSSRGRNENQSYEGAGSLSAQDRKILLQGAIVFISKVEQFLHFFFFAPPPNLAAFIQDNIGLLNPQYSV